MRDPTKRFLNSVRWRIRLAWLTATLQTLAPILGLVLLVSALIEWLTRLESVILYAGAAAIAVIVLSLLWASVMPISDWAAARTAERGLRAHDALTTALEFNDQNQPFHAQIQVRANWVAEKGTSREAVRLIAYRDRLRQAAFLATAAMLIALLPPLG